MPTFQNILLPLDIADTANAERAIESARLIAGASGGRVHLLHVLPFMPVTYARYLPDGFDAEERRDAETALAEWASRVGLPEERVTRTLRRGAVAAEALDVGAKLAADLIIIGSHMPSFTSRLMGSNASAIVRDAKVNVLVVRGEPAAG